MKSATPPPSLRNVKAPAPLNTGVDPQNSNMPMNLPGKLSMLGKVKPSVFSKEKKICVSFLGKNHRMFNNHI